MNQINKSYEGTFVSGNQESDTGAGTEVYDVIVFCHLRWGFVYQRPQHIVSRLARTRKVLFIEEPVGCNEGEFGTANMITVNDNLTVMQPRVNRIEEISEVISNYLPSKNIALGWFYSAAFSPLIGAFNFETIVYDCMDELSMFRGASSELVAQEKYLLSEADLVFTGGKSLYESKTTMHDDVYCFPSSVDRLHFHQATSDIQIPNDIAELPKPVIGYYGVIDERIDLGLLSDTANQNPHVSFVMIGPLAKIADHDLPKHVNIHYLGMKGYNELPHYLKCFDIAMMPFALNDATLFISPTKSLEYMAAGKPIISTAIKDVIRDYSNCIHIVSSPDQFSDAIQKCMTDSNDEKQRIYAEILDNTSWDKTVFKMEKIIKNKQTA